MGRSRRVSTSQLASFADGGRKAERAAPVQGGERKKRRVFLIDRQFQYAFMLRFSGAVIGGVLLSFLVLSVYYALRYGKGDLALSFFYASGEPGSGLRETTLPYLVGPSLVVSAALSCAFTLLFGLFYSHRIAGPIFNLKRVLREIRTTGKVNQEVRLRKGDEFHDLAEEVNLMLQWVRENLRRRRS